MRILSSIPATSPGNSIISARGHLATFANAYAVAIRLKEATGASQFIVSTQDPAQPFRVLPAPPSDPCRIVSTIA